MSQAMRKGWIELETQRLEYRLMGPDPQSAPTLVMLHEGLGSADLWGDLPAELAKATGCGVLTYSRAGYGASSPVTVPRPYAFMHDEALTVLPRVLDRFDFRRGLLIGASDGASIATIYAGRIEDHRVQGLTLIAPHFIIEDQTAAGARAAKLAYEQGDLKGKLARWHNDVDGAFYGWNQTVADPEFQRSWDITDALAYIRVPIQILQGENDEYGTHRQIEIAEAECYCPVEATIFPGAGHSIHREALEQTTQAIVPFVHRVLR